jgi:hypothetical protein
MTLGEIINNQLYKIVELKRQLWEAEKELTRLNNQYAYGLLACYVMNIEATENAPKPAITIVNIPAKSGVSSDLGRVHVDWRNTGHSSGSYAILSEDERSYMLSIGTDPNKPMRMRVSKARCKKVETVAEEKAA